MADQPSASDDPEATGAHPPGEPTTPNPPEGEAEKGVSNTSAGAKTSASDESSKKRGDFEAVETVRIDGHIIDSLILPKVLDLILREGCDFNIKGVEIGRERRDRSWAEIEVRASSPAKLDEVLTRLTAHGALPRDVGDCVLTASDVAGTLPEGFYSSTNLVTEVRINGKWVKVQDQEMDCGVVVNVNTTTGPPTAKCVPMHRIKAGEKVVCGRTGVRVKPLSRQDENAVEGAEFQFMSSAVSVEKPKGVSVRDIARVLKETRAKGQKVLVVGGPAIVHTGAGPHMCRLIREGYIQVLFAGNALAAHDIEQSFFQTSLGVHLEHGRPVDEGHEHHLRAINRIRRCGSIAKAVDEEIITSGIMYECVKNNVEFVLAGSIRDDGPLPDVITDAVKAIDRMREMREGVGFALMIATLLHSIATGNILPASVGIACVDINPATVTKLADRGTSHSMGIVTDVEPFLRALVHELLGSPS